MRVLALHGVPTSPRLWERLKLPPGCELVRPTIPGLGVGNTPDDWNLTETAEELRPLADDADVVVGHDLGGVLAAMIARPGQRVVLSGTALGPYWTYARISAGPVLWRFFYKRHAGKLFLRRGCMPEHADDLVEAFGDHGDEWPMRMRRIAKAMSPPPELAQRLRKNRVALVWGAKDPWYPRWQARLLANATGGRLHLVDAGHFAPWEAPTGFSDVLRAVGRQQG